MERRADALERLLRDLARQAGRPAVSLDLYDASYALSKDPAYGVEDLFRVTDSAMTPWETFGRDMRENEGQRFCHRPSSNIYWLREAGESEPEQYQVSEELRSRRTAYMAEGIEMRAHTRQATGSIAEATNIRTFQDDGAAALRESEPGRLHPLVAQQIRSAHERLVAAGEQLTRDDLARHYATFRDRFAPGKLEALDGPPLLTTIHDHGDRESLVYWLEFKNDDEMPAKFGSIAGGSALKFGIYRRKETGAWMTGSSMAQRELRLEEAIEIARRNRDQLIAGARACEAAGTPADYDALQAAMGRVAPDVQGLAWGHKYFHMLFPELLDDYHAPSYQSFHLRKMLLPPPAIEGRYRAAAGFVRAAGQLGLAMNQLTRALNERNGSPHSYWRIGTGTGQEPRREWTAMRDGGFVSIGWASVGSLATLDSTMAGRDYVKSRLAEEVDTTPQANGRAAAQIHRFVTRVAVGDVVVAADGMTCLGIGRVTGEYEHSDGADFPHRHKVHWLAVSDFRLPTSEGLQTSVHRIDSSENILAIEKLVLESPPPAEKPRTVPGPTLVATRPLPPALSAIVARVHGALERKGQVILYGPPGTGKTHHAEQAAQEILARAWLNSQWSDLSKSEQAELRRNALAICSFHAAYGYEDFLEGFRPHTVGSTVGFECRPGIFKELCGRASTQPEARPFILIIDEINRGDVPRIFGELLTVIEKTRRGQEIVLPLSRTKFAVPPNVLLIATMNTADRSIALLDAGTPCMKPVLPRQRWRSQAVAHDGDRVEVD